MEKYTVKEIREYLEKIIEERPDTIIDGKKVNRGSGKNKNDLGVYVLKIQSETGYNIDNVIKNITEKKNKNIGGNVVDTKDTKDTNKDINKDINKEKNKDSEEKNRGKESKKKESKEKDVREKNKEKESKEKDRREENKEKETRNKEGKKEEENKIIGEKYEKKEGIKIFEAKQKIIEVDAIMMGKWYKYKNEIYIGDKCIEVEGKPLVCEMKKGYEEINMETNMEKYKNSKKYSEIEKINKIVENNRWKIIDKYVKALLTGNDFWIAKVVEFVEEIVIDYKNKGENEKEKERIEDDSIVEEYIEDKSKLILKKLDDYYVERHIRLLMEGKQEAVTMMRRNIFYTKEYYNRLYDAYCVGNNFELLKKIYQNPEDFMIDIFPLENKLHPFLEGNQYFVEKRSLINSSIFNYNKSGFGVDKYVSFLQLSDDKLYNKSLPKNFYKFYDNLYLTLKNKIWLDILNETIDTMSSFQSFDKDYICDMIYIYQKQFNITFNPKQKECIYKLFSSSWKLYTICGYAGTGKSEITLFINYVLSKHNNSKVLFCTPTNSQYSSISQRLKDKQLDMLLYSLDNIYSVDLSSFVHPPIYSLFSKYKKLLSELVDYHLQSSSISVNSVNSINSINSINSSDISDINYDSDGSENSDHYEYNEIFINQDQDKYNIQKHRTYNSDKIKQYYNKIKINAKIDETDDIFINTIIQDKDNFNMLLKCYYLKTINLIGTIHSQILRKKLNNQHCDISIYDESGMVDLGLFVTHLFKFKKPGILVGDDLQLNPISGYSLFNILVSNSYNYSNFSKLDHVERCSNGDLRNNIMNITHNIPLNLHTQNSDFIYYHKDNDLYLLSLIDNFIKSSGSFAIILPRSSFNQYDENFKTRISSKIGSYSKDLVDLINNYSYFTLFNKKFDINNLSIGSQVKLKQKVIFDDFELGKHQIGVITHLLKDSYTVSFNSRSVDIHKKYLELSYCLTTNISQGSEFDNVLYICNIALGYHDKSNLYVAISRAKKSFQVYDSTSCFSQLSLKTKRIFSGVYPNETPVFIAFKCYLSLS
mgnify:CR=1 FL=1